MNTKKNQSCQICGKPATAAGLCHQCYRRRWGKKKYRKQHGLSINSSADFRRKGPSEKTKSIINDLKNTNLSLVAIAEKYGITKQRVFSIREQYRIVREKNEY